MKVWTTLGDSRSPAVSDTRISYKSPADGDEFQTRRLESIFPPFAHQQ